MVEIPLTQGQVAFVDDEDASLAQLNWFAHKSQNGKTFYAVRKVSGRRVFLHHAVLGIDEKIRVDHRDGNTLNCRRENLRPATQNQNAKNRKKNKNCISGFKGVHRKQGNRRKPWEATITSDGKRYSVGTFETAEEAAKAYDKAAIKLHGEFARLNFPNEEKV